MVIKIRQNQDNIVNLSVETSVTDPYFLITFTNPFTTASFNALFHEIPGESSYYTINIEEVGRNGTIDYVNGKVKLSPAGSWELVVYAQTSSTNLDPALADENLGSYDLIVSIPDVCIVYPPIADDTFCAKLLDCDDFVYVLDKADLIVTDGYGDKFLNDQGVYVTVSGGGSNITLTTIGNSGPSTLISDVLNIPEYTLVGLGGQAQLNGTGFVKISGTTISYDNSTYLTENQNITLSGDISGSGTTAITTTIGAGKVTNDMLAGSIAYSKLSLTGSIVNADLVNSSITVNGTNISLGGSGTITAAAGTLTGTTLNSTVVTSSITTLGTMNDILFASAKGIKDANGNYVIVLPSTVASAVNYFTVSNSATGGDVSITATGSDTNINILYSTKGTGVHRFNAAIHLFNGTSYVEALRAATTTLNFGAGFSAISFSVTTTFAGISSSAGAILTGGNFLTGTAGNIYMNNGTSGGTGLGQRVIHMYNGTAPAPSVTTDRHQYYSADIVAGNAAPHFLTEAGDLIKLYSVSGWGTPTGTLTRTTFDSGTVTLPQLAERVAALISDLKTGHGLLKA